MAETSGVRAARLYQRLVEPVLALLLKRRRLRMLGLGDAPLPDLAVDWRAEQPCGPDCPLDPARTPRLFRRYVRRVGGAGRTRLTPMVIALDALPDLASFDRILKQRSSRTLGKVRKAAREGYVVHRFPIETHVYDVHAIRTSLSFRAAGPVLDRWLLKPEQIATPATGAVAPHHPGCANHWTIWWGAFLPEPGHRQGIVEVGERLVAFVRLMRIGDIVHYTEIMGHGAHRGSGVMLLLHREIARWLIEAGEPAARGVRALLYGALEHGGAGLLTWKKRAGFVPVRLREGRAGLPDHRSS